MDYQENKSSMNVCGVFCCFFGRRGFSDKMRLNGLTIKVCMRRVRIENHLFQGEFFVVITAQGLLLP